jgi:hypothetical protein
LNSGGCGVFSRFGIIVMEIWRAVSLVSICLSGCNGIYDDLVRGGGEETNRVSSGRDMISDQVCSQNNVRNIEKVETVVRKKLRLQFEFNMRLTQVLLRSRPSTRTFLWGFTDSAIFHRQQMACLRESEVNPNMTDTVSSKQPGNLPSKFKMIASS